MNDSAPLVAAKRCARCGSPLLAPPCPLCLLDAPLPPASLGPHFILEEELGRGAMGTVFRAIDTRIDRACAIKLLPERATAQASTAGGFTPPRSVTEARRSEPISAAGGFTPPRSVTEARRSEPISAAGGFTPPRSVTEARRSEPISAAGGFTPPRSVTEARRSEPISAAGGFTPPRSVTEAQVLAREAHILARLNHPRIVTLYEAGELDGELYIAMELVEGPSLRALLSDGQRLAPLRAVNLALDVCEALEAAHALGIVHRDVKPDNVLIDSAGRAKLGDFGIARAVRAGVPTHTSGLVAGTPRYMAPELAQGMPPSAMSDIFALGVMLYELCTGVQPEGDFSPLPWPLDGVARRAMAQEPARRFQSAADLRAALIQARDSLVTGSLPPEERVWLRAVALLFAAASGLFLWALLQSLSPVVITKDNDVYALVRLVTRTLPDGRVVSYARLEIGAMLAALAAFAVAGAAYGLLRRHWRQAGLEDPRPERPLPQGRALFSLGLLCLLVFAVRRALIASGFTLAPLYIPVLGGLLELWVLYVLWDGLLEAARTSRAVHREWLLWLGLWLALLPPAIELLTYIASLG